MTASTCSVPWAQAPARRLPSGGSITGSPSCRARPVTGVPTGTDGARAGTGMVPDAPGGAPESGLANCRASTGPRRGARRNFFSIRPGRYGKATE